MNKPIPFDTIAIPELEGLIAKFGCRMRDNPLYVIIGRYHSEALGPRMGILAGASNEFHAHLLHREISKGGHCQIRGTEHHPDPSRRTFSLEKFKSSLQRHNAKVM